MNHLPMFSWLHISDLHIKNRDGSGRDEIAALIEDLQRRGSGVLPEKENRRSPRRSLSPAI